MTTRVTLTFSLAVITALAAVTQATGQSALPPPSNATWVNDYQNQVVNPYVECWSEGYFTGTVCFNLGTAFACGTPSGLNIGESYETTVGFEYDGFSFSFSHTYEVQQNFGPHVSGPCERCQWVVCYAGSVLRKWTCRRQYSFWSWTTTDYTFSPGDGGTVFPHCEPYACPGCEPVTGGDDGGECCGGEPPENVPPGMATMLVDLDNYFVVDTGVAPPVHPINDAVTSVNDLNLWHKCVIQSQIQCISQAQGVPIVELIVVDVDDTEHHFDLLLDPNPFSLPALPWYEDFDGYISGSQLHGQGGWKGWDDDPAFSAPVSSAQARSGSNSADISGTADLVREYCTDGVGAWSYTAWQYIPSDFTSGGGAPDDGTFFILLNTYSDTGPDHTSVQMKFDSNDGSCKVAAPLEPAGFVSLPYETDRWVKIQTIVDLDHDWTQVYYDDQLVTEYTWTGGVLGDGGSTSGLGGGALDIAAVDLYAKGSSSVFYDDMLLEPIELCPADLNNDDTVNVADLLDMLTAWGPNPGHPADLNDDGQVNVADLLLLLAVWGPCF